MKIIHVIDNIDDRYGGPAKSIPYLNKYLIREGCHSSIVSVKLYKDEHNEVISRNKLIHEAFPYILSKKLRYSPKLKKNILHRLSGENDIILHLHNLWNYPSYLLDKIKLKYGTKIVVSPRGSLYSEALEKKSLRKKVAYKFFQKDMLNRVDCIHATNPVEKEMIRKAGIENRIEIVPNGIDLEGLEINESKEASQNALGLSPSKNYLLFLSRIHIQKGVTKLLHVWADVCKEFPEWHLIIAGLCSDPVLKKNIDSFLIDKKIMNRVLLPGFVKGIDRVRYYNASDIFILPSDSENFGMAIAESLAMGIPVITTKNTPWEIIKKMNLGYWTDNSVESIRNAVIALIKNKSDFQKRCRAMGPSYIRDNYSLSSVAKNMIRIYESL